MDKEYRGLLKSDFPQGVGGGRRGIRGIQGS